jgi:hypothetical protein
MRFVFDLFIYVRFCTFRANWPPQRGGADTWNSGLPYSCYRNISGSFKCPVCCTDTLDLGLYSHPKYFLVRRGIELTTPGLTVCSVTTTPRPPLVMMLSTFCSFVWFCFYVFCKRVKAINVSSFSGFSKNTLYHI